MSVLLDKQVNVQKGSLKKAQKVCDENERTKLRKNDIDVNCF